MSQMMISNKYEPTSGIQWTPEYSWTSDKIQKQASKCRPVNFLALEFWQLVSLLMELSIGNKPFLVIMCIICGGFLQLCTYVVFANLVT